MEKAREAVAQFTGRHGHTTEVDETVRGAVTEEHIRPARHEESTQAIDREVHQHHHHTTVQPLQHREVLPEKHSHQMLPAEERSFQHGNEEEARARLEQERAQFRDSTVTHETSVTSSQAPQVLGEHVHHHVHEHVQPVINKETIAPEVIHTTQPIHELHQATAQHHGTSILPTKTLEEFTSGGGVLEGTRGSHTHETYDGVPRQYNKSMQPNPTDADLNPGYTGVEGPDSHHTGGTNLSAGEPFTDKNPMHRLDQNAGPGTSGAFSSGGERGLESDLSGRSGAGTGADYRSGGGMSGGGVSGRAERGLESDLEGRSGAGTGADYRSGGGMTGRAERDLESDVSGHAGNTGMGSGGRSTGGVGSAAERYEQDKGLDRGYGNSGTTQQKKPSLMDRLNPMKDT